MKIKFTLTIILFVLLFTGCNTKGEKELIIGEWEFKSSINLRTNKTIKKAKRNDPFYAIINKKFIVLTDKKNNNDKFHWKMKNSIIEMNLSNNEIMKFHIKELTEKKMVVEFNSPFTAGKLRIIFGKN